MVIDPNTLRRKIELTMHSFEQMAKTERERPDWVRGVIYGLTLAIGCLPEKPQ